jgi:hypothetical protein
MREVTDRFVSTDAFRNAASSDVGLAVLQGLARECGPPETWGDSGPKVFSPINNLVSGIVSGVDDSARGRAAAGAALTWLFSHDLIAELNNPGGNIRGTIVPTPLGYEVAATVGAPGAAAHAMRVADLIPATLFARVLPPLLAGDYDMSITAACKAVEVRMRDRAGLSSSDYGSRLARKFFERVTSTVLQRMDRKGDLADEEHLFEGVFGLYRDRAVHEAPHVDSMEYALEIIIAASHLLQIVEAAKIEPATSP